MAQETRRHLLSPFFGCCWWWWWCVIVGHDVVSGIHCDDDKTPYPLTPDFCLFTIFHPLSFVNALSRPSYQTRLTTRASYCLVTIIHQTPFFTHTQRAITPILPDPSNDNMRPIQSVMHLLLLLSGDSGRCTAKDHHHRTPPDDSLQYTATHTAFHSKCTASP